MFLVAFDVAAILRSALPFIGILLVLVVLHEFGHFVAAKAFGVKVLEFGVGFPPKIWGKKFGETEYTVNWLPIGGFVRLLGEEDPTDPKSLAAQARWKRLTVLYAGVAMNFGLAILLMSIGFMIPRERSLSLAQIVQVAPDSPAAEATVRGTMRDGSEPLQGLQAGDLVLEAAGRDIKNTTELVYAIRLNLGETQTWLINRGGSTLEADVYARWSPPEGEGNVGVRIGAPASCSDIDADGNPTNCALLYPFTEDVSYTPWAAVDKGFWSLIESAILTKNELQMRFMGGGGGAASSGPAFQGPVGIAAVTGDVIKQAGWRSLIEISALLSLNLAVFNMLPLPMLDGGRAFIIFIEILRGGKRIAPEKEALFHLTGFALLMASVLVVTYFDIARLVS
ncbi:MAG: M50 family metallopeptidase [Dehalococcoidia bacterium]|nr:site-2 protease family protein [Dehalococcoidia bacterium]MCB9485360.1 site-2 protease family protein [Thermoflexaceae bacterium]